MRSKLGACIAVAGFCTLITAANVNAAPLGLTLNDYPDILANFISVQYLAGSLSASGTATTFDDDGVGAAEFISSGIGSYSLSATVDNAGIMTGGTLNIFGTVTSLGFTSGTLLTGNLTGFGFQVGGGSPLEFLFTVTGGDAATMFGGVGSTAGSIISSGLSGFTGSFMGDWSGTAGGSNSDTAPVPIPGTALLLFSGLGGLVAARRNRKN